ncbi:MAG: hypothetical protein R3B09_07200 [Nannocystaceae bacterium]
MIPPTNTLLAAALAAAPAPPAEVEVEGPQAEGGRAEAAAHAHPDEGGALRSFRCRCVYGGDHKVHTRNLVGFKFYNVNIFQVGERDEVGEPIPGSAALTIYPMFGAGLFYERELIRNWLEIEINVLVLADARAKIVPFELYLKKPFHVHRRLTPYVGVGPTLDLLFEERRPFPFFGLGAVVGAYFWATKSLGFDVDLGYTLVFEERPAHDLNLGFGPVLHF